MKIQLDTDRKTIKLASNEKLSEIIVALEKLLPKGKWKEYTLETSTVINNWSSPIYWNTYPNYWNTPVYTSGGTTLCANNAETVSGTYNIEC